MMADPSLRGIVSWALMLFALTAGSSAAELEAARTFAVEGSTLSELGRRAEQAPEPTWLAYTIAGIAGHWCCCGHGHGTRHGATDCDLEATSGDHVQRDLAQKAGPLTVLVRYEAGRAERLRVVDDECRIGLGASTLLQAGDRSANESLAWLQALLDDERTSLGRHAIDAIAFHLAPQATDVLAAVARSSSASTLRRQAIFWLGAARGEAGLPVLVELLDGETDASTLEAIVFAIDQSSAAEAEETLVTLARQDSRPTVRRQALFWLGQAGDRFAELILEAALEDSSREVARHAVFVLGQLPAPSSSRILGRLVVQQSRPELRREALFWLAQTGSDEALEVLARILETERPPSP